MPTSAPETEALLRGGAAQPVVSAQPRLLWLDVIKGFSILWIVFFHFFKEYSKGLYPVPWAPHYFATFFHGCAPASAAAALACFGRSIFVAVTMLGFGAVGVFIVMSGFGLTYSLARTGGPEHGWGGWYKSRVVRLFPMFWVAHVVYLVSPFEARYDPIDYRFILSFLGDRIVPVQMIEYLVPAWWYFGLILELYLIFPLLFRLLQKAGAGWFLVICAAETVLCRYILLFNIYRTDGMVISAFCGSRLWEFAFGMVVGLAYRQNRTWVDDRLFSARGMVAGLAIYTAGQYSFYSTFTYIFMDALVGTGLFVILAQLSWHSRRFARVEAALAYVGVYSYGLYLIHQPYATNFGVRMRGMNTLEFVAITAAMITVIALVSSYLERWANSVTNRLLTGPAPAAVSAKG
ncbi:MAG TPA: acyltransferase [Candidatus Acidoferrales bacterium]|nr:acyltransferase [Candidatus Acidoferrales bacterium]